MMSSAVTRGLVMSGGIYIKGMQNDLYIFVCKRDN